MKSTSQVKTELTQSQLLLWSGQKLDPESPIHNTTHTFIFSEAIDEVIFKRAFALLIEKTDVLRATFGEEGGIPYMSFCTKYDFEIEVVELSFEPDTEQYSAYILNRSQKSVELEKQVFDSALLKTPAGIYIWFLNMHHLVTDAISATLVFKRMAALYGRLRDGDATELPDTPRFIEYMKFEERQSKGTEDEQVRAYWDEKIRNAPQKPSFYGIRSDYKTTRSSRISVNLGPERSHKLRSLTKEGEFRTWTEDLSLFLILNTVFFAYLYRISGQERLAVGAPAHNRLTPGFNQTIGLFIEIFPLVVELGEGDTFLDLFKRLRLEANDYLRNARPGMTNSQLSGGFNAILNFIHASFGDFAGIGVKSEWVHTNHIDRSHQLRCHIVDFDQTAELEVLFDVNHETFSKDLRNYLPKHFLAILDSALKDMDTLITGPELITETEKALLLKSTTAPYGENDILGQFLAWVRKSPDAIAIRFKEEKLTYRELNTLADQLANLLEDQGIGEGERIGIHFFRNMEYVVSLLAVMKLGGTFVPVSSDQPAERLAYLIADSACSLMLADKELAARAGPKIPVMPVSVKELKALNNLRPKENIPENSLAYILYTSGSTGNPKGVMISTESMENYLGWAKNHYGEGKAMNFPLFTSIGFDLTLTSTFLPLISGGELVIYPESQTGPDVSLIDVIAENKVNAIKLTPSHIRLILGADLSTSILETMIVGGEDFRTDTARQIDDALGGRTAIYNEYGPTEATVGCVVARYKKDEHTALSVPIGTPIDNMQAYVVDQGGNLAPIGVEGELYLAGKGLAKGYANKEAQTNEKFVANPFKKEDRVYKTGDLARWNFRGELEFLGRKDTQIKLNGFRIELADVETNLQSYGAIQNSAVVLIEPEKSIPEEETLNCTECGLPSNYPNADFDDQGVCHLCNAFKGYKEKTDRYFKTEKDLKELLLGSKSTDRQYDCLSLLSGGKDSTYVLARLVDMGLKVLTFTLDNGYISDQAKANIDRIVQKLGVDHIYGQTQYMNKIFVDSLKRHANVCNGCFKTIYTLSTQIALDKDIPFIVTGLSRGQFFETRLTEELFWDDEADTTTIDQTILEARKLYHQEEDAVKKYLEPEIFLDPETFEKVQFVDFYRYCDVSLEEMLRFLKDQIGWERPTDTGRSTNCLINQVGIYVHKKEKGYSNYSFPYSWDVRLGHKTREETLEEINEYIEEAEVKRIMNEIGFTEHTGRSNSSYLVGYYTAASKLSAQELNTYLADRIPRYMIPSAFKRLEELPITSNGKIDRAALKSLNHTQLEMDAPYIAPRTELEELVESIWKEVLELKKIGVKDNFVMLGGHSLAAIRVTTRINEELQLKIPLGKIFELPTIEEYASFIEGTIVELLE